MKEPSVQIFYKENNEPFVKQDATFWIISRHPRGHLNSYIALPVDHPCYWDEQESPDYEVHGGVTYDSKESPLPTVFNNPKFKFRFIGFDTNHIGYCGDYFDDSLREEDCREFDDSTANAGIKDIPFFVYEELEKLAQQIEDRARQLRTAQLSEPMFGKWERRTLAKGKGEPYFDTNNIDTNNIVDYFDDSLRELECRDCDCEVLRELECRELNCDSLTDGDKND